MDRSPRLLIVEDSTDDTELILLALRRGGLNPTWERVETADGLRAALAAGSWDAVLTDYTLPALGAADALDIVRDFSPDLPCVVVSGTVGEELAVATMRAGANDYVLKDNLARLAPALRRELEQADHRRARREAAQAVARLAAIVSGADYAIISQTLDGVITSWNAGAERLYGYAAAEAVGRHASFLLPPDDTELDAARDRVTRGESVPAFDAVRIHKDGRRLDVSVSLAPIRDAAERVVGISGIGTDISERKRAADALERGEREQRHLNAQLAAERARLVAAQAVAKVGSWETDLETLEVSWSLETYRIFEVDPDEFRPTHAGFLSLVHPDDREPVARAFDRSSDRSDPCMIQHRIVVPGGRVKFVEERWQVFQNRDGKSVRALGTCQDVTQQKETDEHLRRSEARYRTLVEATAAIVWNSPASGAFDTDQPAWTAFTGQTLEQHKGRGWLDAVHPDDRDKTERAWIAAVRDCGTYQVEHRLRRADGAYHTMMARAVPILDASGALREWVGVHYDVTEQKRAEEALRLRDRAIQAVTQGILICDATASDCPIIYVGPGFERLTGYAAAEVLGRNCRFLQGPDTDRTAITQLRTAVRAGEPRTVELLNYRKDGTPFWNELSISPVTDSDGRLTHFVGVQVDVTARRSLEEQFRQVQKMEAVGQLAAGVAHDFNNLLTIINGYSHLLLQDRSPSDPSWELLDEIHKAGKRSAGLTRQLLAFSRQQVLSPRVLNLNEVATDTDKMLRRLIGEDVRLVSALAPDLWSVRADPGQVEQVLMNLAVNARDAMPRGGQLTIETGNVELDTGYARNHPDARTGPHAVLRVTDTGCGMPPEVLARVFEPFFTTKGPGKGTGLGLATVYGIVKQSGGHVAVTSTVGVGTTFAVYLPRSDEPEGSKVRSGLQVPPRGTETVLLVEDEIGVRTLTRHVLSGCGYRVLEAGDGDEAVRVAAGHGEPIRLLITDVVLPGAGGRVVAERVVQLHPAARVLYVSGYTDDAILRYGVSRERVHFLPKPYSPLALACKTREVLDARA